jgi:hypothetical protein
MVYNKTHHPPPPPPHTVCIYLVTGGGGVELETNAAEQTYPGIEDNEMHWPLPSSMHRAPSHLLAGGLIKPPSASGSVGACIYINMSDGQPGIPV